MRARALSIAIALSAAGLMSSGCAPLHAEHHPVTGVNPDGSPRWVNRGSGKFNDPHGKAFYGVGIVQGIRNIGLARQTAGNRARGEVAKIFDTYIAAMMKDYQRSTTAGDFSKSSEEQDVVSAQKTLTEVTLRGVMVEDHWTDPQNGALYALAVLRLDGMLKALGDNKQLNAKVRDHVRANAARAFDDLDRAVHRRNNPSAAPAPPPPPAPEASAPPPHLAAPAPSAAPAGSARVGIKIKGSNASTIQTCLVGKLIEQGFEVFEGTSDVDYMVAGTLKYKKAGVADGEVVMVEANANIKVGDLRNSRTVASMNETLRAGRPSLKSAVQLAVTRLCTQVVPKVAAAIRSRVR